MRVRGLLRRRQPMMQPIRSIEGDTMIAMASGVRADLTLDEVSVVDATYMPSESPFGLLGKPGDQAQLGTWVHCIPRRSDELEGLPVRPCGCEGIRRGHDHLVTS